MTELIIGPLLSDDGGYYYETFTREEGPRSSFRYSQIERARYDRRALVAEARAGRRNAVRDCDTKEDFDRLVAELQREDTPSSQ